MGRRAVQGAAIVVLLLGAAASSAEPLKQPITGPMLVCFKYSTFQLSAGESLVDFDGGPEAVRLKVTSLRGQYDIGESEIFADPKGEKELVAAANNTSVYRVFGKGRRYAIYGPTSFSEGRDKLVIWLSGAALSGRKRDREIYSRFQVRDTQGVKCPRTFTYAWDFSDS